ncbi:MAG: preprotein translocase subunit YajC [Alphaproteobacteria bacterium]|nr:preprotein translocase subunit YajC [Alphaproteobacteria bacterium]MCL2505067.1 preprotein translocase subunit YajC [Alphaproteobacteria bacterium]
MFLDNLFVSMAYAQDATETIAEAQPIWLSMLPFILIFAVFYFLVIRPQQKRLVEQDKLIRSVKPGDRVILSGGIHGKIIKIDETAAQVTVEIASGVEILIDREAILSLENKSESK